MFESSISQDYNNLIEITFKRERQLSSNLLSSGDY